MKNLWAYVAAMVLLGVSGMLGGCSGGAGSDPRGDYLKPTVAVMKFENRAAFPLGWKIGDGTADILVDRLVATGRFHVIERPELDAVLKELRLQASGSTRSQNKAAPGQLKNVQYLIKGTVTDFGHVSGGTGFFSGGGVDLLGRRNRAVMSITIYVVDVQSGEIICSQTLSESIATTDMNVKAVYRDVAFGGSGFYRTPLGKATAAVLDKAVRNITATIASRPWEPKIAVVQTDRSVIINGGSDRMVRVGAEYDVMEAAPAVIDPDTGDVIGHQSGRVVARVRVRQVQERLSVADVTAGNVRDVLVGQRLRKGF